MTEHAHQPVKRVALGLVHVATAKEPEHEDLRDRILGLLMISAGVDVVTALVAFFTERHEQGAIHTFWDALYFTTTQLLTISSQVPNPISTDGKILNVFIQVYAMVVVSSVAGAFGGFFMARHRRRHPVTPG